MKYDWIDISDQERNKWEEICPPGEYRIIPASALSGVLPDSLINKYNSALVMGSASPYGNVYYMANGNRVDGADAAIDQMPFGLAFIPHSAPDSGKSLEYPVR